MEKKLWFRRKTYGATPPTADARTNFLREFVLGGWTPATWEGWFVIVLYALILVSIFRSVDLGSHSGSDTLINFAPQFLLVTLGLCIVCAITGEKPKWQWGRKHTDAPHDER